MAKQIQGCYFICVFEDTNLYAHDVYSLITV